MEEFLGFDAANSDSWRKFHGILETYHERRDGFLKFAETYHSDQIKDIVAENLKNVQSKIYNANRSLSTVKKFYKNLLESDDGLWNLLHPPNDQTHADNRRRVKYLADHNIFIVSAALRLSELNKKKYASAEIYSGNVPISWFNAPVASQKSDVGGRGGASSERMATRFQNQQQDNEQQSAAASSSSSSSLGSKAADLVETVRATLSAEGKQQAKETSTLRTLRSKITSPDFRNVVSLSSVALDVQTEAPAAWDVLLEMSKSQPQKNRPGREKDKKEAYEKLSEEQKLVADEKERKSIAKKETQKQLRILVAFSVLMKERYKNISGLQALISLILVKHGAKKQLFNQLEKMGMANSYNATWQSIIKEIIPSVIAERQEFLERVEKRLFGAAFDNCNMLQKVCQRYDRKNNMYNLCCGFLFEMYRHDETLLPNSTIAQGGRDHMDPRRFFPTAEDFEQLDLYIEMTSCKYALDVFKDSIKDKARKKIVAYIDTIEARLLDEAKNGFPDFLFRNDIASIPTPTPIYPFPIQDLDEKDPKNVIKLLKFIFEVAELDADFKHRIYVWGDLLTASRIRTAKWYMSGDHQPPNALRDLTCVIENFGEFHCAWAFLDVLYANGWGNSSDVCSISFAHSLLQRRTNDKDANHFFRAEELTQVIVQGFASGCMINSIRSELDDPAFRPGAKSFGHLKNSQDVADLVIKVSKSVVKSLSQVKSDTAHDGKDQRYNLQGHVKKGYIYFYQKYGIRRANSFINFRGHKFMHPIFIGSHATNYALDLFRLFLRLHHDLSEYDAYIIFHNRYCSEVFRGSGGTPRYIPWDLRNEHYVDDCKEPLKVSMANLNLSHAQKVSMITEYLKSMTNAVKSQTNVVRNSISHSTPSLTDDVSKLANAYISYGIFDPPSRVVRPSVHAYANPEVVGYDKMRERNYMQKRANQIAIIEYSVSGARRAVAAAEEDSDRESSDGERSIDGDAIHHRIGLDDEGEENHASGLGGVVGEEEGEEEHYNNTTTHYTY